MLSPMQARFVVDSIRHARKLLLAKVVVSLRMEGEPRYKELEVLQDKFEYCIRRLPIWLRSERFLDKHVVQPAQRELERVGVLDTARAMKGWTL